MAGKPSWRGDDRHAAKRQNRLIGRIRSTPLLALLLDFDGTLVELADRPSNVRVEPSVAKTLENLVGRPGVRVAIVSGRSIRDLRSFIHLEGIYLAGNHGLEIDGPGLHFLEPEASRRIAEVPAIAAELRAGLERFPGVLVEEKGLSVACHDRGVADFMVALLRAEIDRIIAFRRKDWRVLAGKRVVEFLPSTAWTKGSCARFLLSRFASESAGRPEPLALAIGDDRTDRDLLEEARAHGIAVAVGTFPGSGWDLRLANVRAVHRFLERIDRLRSDGARRDPGFSPRIGAPIRHDAISARAGRSLRPRWTSRPTR